MSSETASAAIQIVDLSVTSANLLGVGGPGFQEGNGLPATSYDGPFSAYVSDITNDVVWRLILVFASRDVADEWWRAISSVTTEPIAGAVQRVNPQFYTHDIRKWNIYEFFGDARIKTISDAFRGKLIITLENDRGGRGITAIPRVPIVDYVSGARFTIRSKARPDLYWYYNAEQGYMTVSDKRRTWFQVVGTNLKDGTVMIGNDEITLAIPARGNVTVRSTGTDGVLLLGTTAFSTEVFKIKLSDLRSGRLVASTDDVPTALVYLPTGGGGEAWELAL